MTLWGGGGEIVTQHNLLTRDGRSFFRDSIYNLESLDMQDALGGMSSSQREADSEDSESEKKIMNQRCKRRR